MKVSPALSLVLGFVGLLALSAGCGPTQAQYDQVKSELFDSRQKNQQLDENIQQLQQQLEEQVRHIESLQALGGEKRLEQLYHTVRIELGRGTTGVDTDGRPGHDAVKVYLQPIDQQGSVIKAAGSAVVRVYDLSAAQNQLLGQCSFGPEELAKNWYSGFISYDYVLTCPFSRPPQSKDLTVWVEFTDYLTGKSFKGQRIVSINLPPQ